MAGGAATIETNQLEHSSCCCLCSRCLAKEVRNQCVRETQTVLLTRLCLFFALLVLWLISLLLLSFLSCFLALRLLMRNKRPLHSKIDRSQRVMWSSHPEEAQKCLMWLKESCDVAIRERGLISLFPDIYDSRTHTEVCVVVCHALQLQDSKLRHFNVCVHDNMISRQSNLWSKWNNIVNNRCSVVFVSVIGLVIGFLSNNLPADRKRFFIGTTAEPHWTLILWDFSQFHPLLVCFWDEIRAVKPADRNITANAEQIYQVPVLLITRICFYKTPF